MSKTLYIGLDIDSTVISHCYPLMNGYDLGAIPWLLRLQDEYPVVFLLNTMRDGDSLQLASDWLTARGVKVGGAGVHPGQLRWTSSPKCHCHVYIEDRAAGTPLDENMDIDWRAYGPMVINTVARWYRYYDTEGEAG